MRRTTAPPHSEHPELLRGISPYLRALLTALLLALTMPGPERAGWAGWWPLLCIALLPLLSALGRLSAKQSICTGMFCGILYNAGLFYWIVPVLQRFGEFHTATAVFVLFLLAAYMALYTALFCLLLNHLLIRTKSGGKSASLLLLTAPVFWTGLDFLRSILFTGFPWMDLGYAVYRQPLLIQAADLGGHYLITFSVVLINTLLFWFIRRIHAAFSSSSDSSAYHFRYPVTIVLLLSCLGGYSLMRYRQVSAETAAADTVLVSAVQGNI